MRRSHLIVGLIAAVASLTVVINASAQSGHFLTSGPNAPTCTDEGTTLVCSGKVAGLGSTTFEIRVDATAQASVVCTNPGGNVAPGQSFAFSAAGTSGLIPTPRSGQFVFSIATVTPSAPANACPNQKWTATVTGVTFGTATLSLFEGGALSDQVQISF